MADGGRRKKKGKSRDGGALGLLIGQRAPGRGEWRVGEVDLVGVTRRRAGGASSGAAHVGAAWRLGRAPGTRVSVGRCQGAGQVALEGFPGSIWPRTQRGRGPPAAYGGRRAKQRNREERDGGEGISAISENSGTYR